MDIAIEIVRDAHGGVRVTRRDGQPIQSDLRYGFVWACIGTPSQPIVDVPEYGVEGMCTLTGGAIAVRASAGRVIENFLDLGHLGFVHAGYLGAEPRNEVEAYSVEQLPQGGILAKNCKVSQPSGGMGAHGETLMDYTYRVKRPFVASFDKFYVSEQPHTDTMYIFAQPESAERTVAHTLVFFKDCGYSKDDLAYVRQIMQLIFLQDKPILENQFPKLLPIGSKMEMPVLADKASVAYRRWLADLGMTYGVLRSPVEYAS